MVSANCSKAYHTGVSWGVIQCSPSICPIETNISKTLNDRDKINCTDIRFRSFLWVTSSSVPCTYSRGRYPSRVTASRIFCVHSATSADSRNVTNAFFDAKLTEALSTPSTARMALSHTPTHTAQVIPSIINCFCFILFSPNQTIVFYSVRNKQLTYASNIELFPGIVNRSAWEYFGQNHFFLTLKNPFLFVLFLLPSAAAAFCARRTAFPEKAF